MSLSLDEWLRDRIYYQVGADYRFQQGVPPPAMGGPIDIEEADPEVVNAWLLPISDYEKLSHVEAATRVGIFDAEAAGSGGDAALYLGIDRLDFARVAFYRDDFSQASLGELLNRLGMYPHGILVSSHFLERNRLVEGQKLTLDIEFNFESLEQEFTIVGVYDYFPTVYPADTEVFVGNLDYLFEQAGDATLHQVWLKTAPDAQPEIIVEQLIAMGIWPVQKEDAGALLAIDEERVERIGLYGVLSVGFLASALIASLGLLVYTYASLQGRLQQISVLRAVGLKTRLVLAMVAVEYGGVILYAVIAGTAIGIATAYLFVPFFRVSGDPVFALPPFVRHMAWTQIGWLTATFTAALMLSQGIILYWATRRDLFQILRMGQRE
jgi:putative ABC transport system permease protein